VSHLFEMAEAEEAASALNGVDRAEDAGERIPILGVLLEHHKFVIKLIQAFQTFGQEFLDDLVHGGVGGSEGRLGFRQGRGW